MTRNVDKIVEDQRITTNGGRAKRACEKVNISEKLEQQQTKELYQEYHSWLICHLKRVYGQQILLTWLFGFVIPPIMLVALILFIIQLYDAINSDDLSGLNSQIVIDVESVGKIDLRSPILGALLLVLSIPLFYIFAKHIFPVKHRTPPYTILKTGSDSKNQDLENNLHKKSKCQIGNALKQTQTIKAKNSKLFNNRNSIKSMKNKSKFKKHILNSSLTTVR